MRPLAVIDLNRFKPINDLYGHYAATLSCARWHGGYNATPAGTVVGRLGGDEFGGLSVAFLLEELPDLLATCDRALVQLRKPMRLSNALVTVGGSAGACVLDGDAPDVGQALRDADAALYVAKREGLLTTKLFDREIREEHQRIHAIEAALMEA